jgi:hypothetical protein
MNLVITEPLTKEQCVNIVNNISGLSHNHKDGLIEAVETIYKQSPYNFITKISDRGVIHWSNGIKPRLTCVYRNQEEGKQRSSTYTEKFKKVFIIGSIEENK